MHCICESKETFNVKLEGEVSADPIWCNQCGCNIDMEEVPISDDLKEELMNWAIQYGEWINWEMDTLCSGGSKLEKEHNKFGQQLTEKVKKELGTKYKISFSPSSSAKMYASLDA